MKKIYLVNLLFFLTTINAIAQNELKNWYFGTGTDGITFINNIPQKLNNKVSGVGYEGMVVVNDPLTGDMLFYSDGDKVINKNQAIMTNGSGMTGHFSNAQGVQSCPVPGSCAKKFYLFTNSAWDNASGQISYSIVDFTTDPLGEVVNKNTLFWNGPSDEGMCLISKPGTYDYWLIANERSTAKYYVWPLTTTGIGLPTTYTFSNTGNSYQMNYDKNSQKFTVTGYGNKRISLFDFNTTTGVLSNETQIGTQFNFSGATRFSPDGTKLYASVKSGTATVTSLFQYNLATSTWTDMNTCCYAHDLKIGPDGKMYFINTYNAAQPISVIDFPNLTAVDNACNYHTLTFNPAFNGEVRRFPETVTLPEPPIANTDRVSITGTSKSITVLNNDSDPQGNGIHIDAIVSQPKLGIAVINGSSINYTANQNYCSVSDTLIYRIAGNDCSTDTALAIIKFADCSTPVIISSFKANIIDKKVALNWQVEEEIGITNYIVQRSISNNNDFISIATINVNENSNNYSFVDNNIQANTDYYYRLQTIENTGLKKYSTIITAKLKEIVMDNNVYPNPTKGNIRVQLNNYKCNTINIELYDQVGKLIQEYKNVLVNNNSINLNLQYLPSGNYMLVVHADTDRIIKRVIKL